MQNSMHNFLDSTVVDRTYKVATPLWGNAVFYYSSNKNCNVIRLCFKSTFNIGFWAKQDSAAG